MGASDNGQTSLKNNRMLIEKYKSKFKRKDYPMPDSYMKPDEGIDKKRLEAAEKNKINTTVFELSVAIGIIIISLYYIFQILNST